MILLLYFYSAPDNNAWTVIDNVNSFSKYSKLNIISFNTRYGIPKELNKLKFSIIILHYSLAAYLVDKKNHQQNVLIEVYNYLLSSISVKIAFFQDEMHNCQTRFKLINELKIEYIYSLLEEKYFQTVYKKNTKVKNIKSYLTGYVSDELINKGNAYYKNFDLRTLDIVCRARKLPLYFGKGSQEKSEIMETFIKIIKDKKIKLKIDMSSSENSRIYGDSWFKFLSDAKFMIGAMAGTSIFDISGKIEDIVEEYSKKNANSNFEELYNNVLKRYENNVNYRTISPRLFECAVSRVCMILYRDSYQGVFVANRNYILLEKNFSNINEVLNQMKDQQLVNNIIDNTYKDVILSGRWHFKSFFKEFDKFVINLNCDTPYTPEEKKTALIIINNRSLIIWMRIFAERLKRHVPKFIKQFIKQLIRNL
jgi:hypothetical protein